MKQFKLTVDHKLINLQDYDLLTPEEIIDKEQSVELTGTFTMKEIYALLYLLNSWVKNEE